MRLVLDTNILIDAMALRHPFDKPAQKLMMLGYLGEHELWMGSSQSTDLINVMTNGGRASEADVARKMMRRIRQSMHVYATNETDFDAVAASTWEDLEDAFVFQTALNVKADAIITRDAAGFAKSPIKVFDCEGFFGWMESEHGVTYAELEL